MSVPYIYELFTFIFNNTCTEKKIILKKNIAKKKFISREIKNVFNKQIQFATIKKKRERFYPVNETDYERSFR